VGSGVPTIYFILIFSECEHSLYVIVRPSVCLSSLTLVRPTQAVEIFGNISMAFLVPWPSLTSTENFTEIVPEEPLRRGELNTRGVAKYSDFGPIDGYISETVQDSLVDRR